MPLKAFDFSKKQDRRMAIDLLNHLIADCMVSESYIRAWAQCDEWVKSPTEDQLRNKADEVLEWREKAIGYWLSMYYYLHEIIENEDENNDGKWDSAFQIFYGLFVLNRDKLHAYLQKIDTGTSSISPSLRKKQYGLFHYYDKRSSAENMRKTMRAKVCHENKFTGSDTP